MPVIPLFFRPERAIVVAEDFAYLELPRHSLREYLITLATYLIHRRSLRMAQKVVCISNATKESAIKYFGIDPQKCAIVPLAAMPLAPAVAVAGLPSQFFLFAGILKERKNVANLIKAFALFAQEEPHIDFVIAGKKEGTYYESLVALTKELEVADRVHFVGYMNDGQMSYLYSKALALVFASKVEGFGMPLIEAMQAGLPVITSSRGALAEVAGNAALLCNPDSPQELAQAMMRIVREPALKVALAEQGERRAKDFSWKKSGSLLAQLLSTLRLI